MNRFYFMKRFTLLVLAILLSQNSAFAKRVPIGSEKVHSLRAQITAINLLNNLNLSVEQMEKIIELAQAAEDSKAKLKQFFQENESAEVAVSRKTSGWAPGWK